MNKKGFTLVEVILVIVIIGIIVVLAIPNILDAIDENRVEGAKSVEKLLTQNLELYNNDKMYGGFRYFDMVDSHGKKIRIYDSESDLWDINELNEPGTYCSYVDYKELVNLNNDIKMGECLLLSPDKSLVIQRIVTPESANSRNYVVSYKYYASIVCGKGLTSDNKYALNGGYSEAGVYYTTTNKPNCN